MRSHSLKISGVGEPKGRDLGEIVTLCRKGEMKDESKTKEQLLNELAEMRQRIAELERAEAERHRAQRIVQEAREYAESIVETLREPLLVLDGDLRIVSANRSFYQIFQVTPEETEGQLLYDLGNRHWNIPALRELLEEILPQNTTFHDFEVEHDFQTIGRKTMLLNARRVYKEANQAQLILLAIEDVTERKEMEEKLMRSKKLAVLGQLAGGVGHELRNPLGVISNAVYYLQTILPDADETTKEYLEMISSEVSHGEKIVSDLLDLSRTKPAEREEVTVSALVVQVLDRHPPPEKVKVTTKKPSDLPPLFVDPRQIEQVLTNLVINAYQAMPEGGRLTIEARAEKGQVYLSVTDTGCGISQENMERLFEPLFTTKPKGIGLGLAVSKNLVEANRGLIEVETEEGKGSTFTVILPTKEAQA